jgi:hypothetical protein
MTRRPGAGQWSVEYDGTCSVRAYCRMSVADRRRTESMGRRASAGASSRPEADASVGLRRAQRAALI